MQLDIQICFRLPIPPCPLPSPPPCPTQVRLQQHVWWQDQQASVLRGVPEHEALHERAKGEYSRCAVGRILDAHGRPQKWPVINYTCIVIVLSRVEHVEGLINGLSGTKVRMAVCLLAMK